MAPTIEVLEMVKPSSMKTVYCIFSVWLPRECLGEIWLKPLVSAAKRLMMLSTVDVGDTSTQSYAWAGKPEQQ
jgi:hypothetical protein